MLRGITTFKCPECGETFEGPDFEWNATVWTAPLTCPKCGCEKCLPKRYWFQSWFQRLLQKF